MWPGRTRSEGTLAGSTATWIVLAHAPVGLLDGVHVFVGHFRRAPRGARAVLDARRRSAAGREREGHEKDTHATWFGSHSPSPAVGVAIVVQPKAVVSTVVEQEVLRFIGNRFVHGRDYARARSQAWGRLRRIVAAVATPAPIS